MNDEPKRKAGRVVFVIVLIVLALAVAGTGTVLLLRSRTPTGTGQSDPKEAVARFLTAVYDDRSATEAAQYVCPQARDAKALAARIDEIRAATRGYDNPNYNWTFDRGPATPTAADVTVHLTMHTGAEQLSEEDLLFRTVYARGWWVCEIHGI